MRISGHNDSATTMETTYASSNACWMAVYTNPRAEKKVADRFTTTGIEHYLPLKTVRRQWSDRVKWVELPVIPSYVFVHCEEKLREQILKTPGVVNFVRYKGRPAKIRDEEMQRMWRFLADMDRITRRAAEFEPGTTVKIEAGPLRGNTGEVVYTKDTRVCVTLESLGLQIRAEVECVLVEEV